MIFGTVFTGLVKTQNKQWIESKVFCLGIPLYVTNTMLVTDIAGRGRRGIEIKTNSTSIIAAIIRPIVTILAVFSVGGYIGNSGDPKWSWLIFPAILSTALMVYCWFFFGKANKHEKFVRKQFAEVFGLYFMPHWLHDHMVASNFEKLKKAYVSKFGTTDWKEKLKSTQYQHIDGFSLYYCLTALENHLSYNAETEALLKDIAAQNP
jgi:hypothetical protein